MIKVNELRIGNYIIDDDGGVARINGFNPFDHSIRCDEAEGCVLLIDVYHELTGKWKMGREADSPECSPIPLTPEWLGRCGFEMDTVEDNCYYTAKWGAIMVQFNQYKELEFMLEDIDLPLIKYLHQLQNLYFALTGEELNVKL